MKKALQAEGTGVDLHVPLQRDFSHWECEWITAFSNIQDTSHALGTAVRMTALARDKLRLDVSWGGCGQLQQYMHF